ncbi:MAG: cell division protein FtsA [Candidatus Saccharimonadales bacterium]
MSQDSSLPTAVGIDLGSSQIRCVVGVHNEDALASGIIGVGVAPSLGIRKGVIYDIANTTSSISAAIDEAERVSGVSIQGATVGVNGQHIVTVRSRGIVAVGSANREITYEDATRAEDAATVMQLPPNREIVQVFPREFTVDGQEHIKDPVGMTGMRLEVDAALVTAATPSLKNIIRSVNQSGVSAHGYVVNSLASARTVLTDQDKESGSVVLDIGANTTSIAVFEEGELLHVAVIPVGSAHVTNDIAIGLRTEIDTAEQIKLQYVNVDPGSNALEENIKIKEASGQTIEVNRNEVRSIAEARLSELFEMVDKELSNINKDGKLPGGAMLCGGGANLKGIAEFAKESLKLPARVKSPRGFSGIVDKIHNPQFTTAIGLMLEDMYGEHPTSSSMNLGAMLGNVREGVSKVFKFFK